MWVISSLIIGAVAAGLLFWLRSRGTKFTWYELVIGIVGVLLLMFGIQNYFGFTSEFESSAANTSLLILVLPAVVLVALAAFLAWRSNRAAA
jgi:uncharacterized membrane protein YeaQ/YmgE (transglycosylase-associated protein family)